MSQKPETVFQRRVLDRLRTIPDSWWEKIAQVSIRGTPDIIGCVRGHFVALELKRAPNAKIDQLQLHKLDKIEEAGGLALVVNPENFEEVFKRLMDL